MSEEKKIDNKKARFSDADWLDPQEIIIGGVGGIGSWVAMFLARIGHELYLFDDDDIDETNMAGQLYRINQIGLNKAQATKDNIQIFTGNNSVEVLGRYTEDSLVSPIIFSCFDNMAARKLMFEKWAQQENREIFIDGRMLAETGMVYCVLKGQEEDYRSELFEDSEVAEAPCSFKATSHCGAFIGSVMVSSLNNYLTNKKLGADIRVIQFRTDFELPLMMLTEFVKPLNVEENAVTTTLKSESEVS